MNKIIWIIGIFSFITMVVTIILVTKTIGTQRKRFSERKEILAEGTTAQAVINSIRQTNRTVGDQPEVLLDLTVTKPDGEVVHTVLKTVIQIVNIPAFQKGKVVEVKYKTIGNEQKFEVVDAYLP
ncbi:MULTISPECIES: hypothetical protein [Paenibacillus]|uniref:Uncharacterized protein n=1 Tax=Paenibacillus vini TaxID=1476024 RepID=A0ABQ4M5J6_9BACL|nr:hypothetical protein [Paenibacillus vini]MDN4068282.1 hypothetical protein [Paenibacillus vini]GIP51236.1 hypothetical protein J42TS3_02710 [Paenibacillus vini]